MLTLQKLNCKINSLIDKIKYCCENNIIQSTIEYSLTENLTNEKFLGDNIYSIVIDLADATKYNPTTLDLTHNLNIKNYIETTMILKNTSFGQERAPARNAWSNNVKPDALLIKGLGNYFVGISASEYYLILKYTKN